jgi:TonB family protein
MTAFLHKMKCVSLTVLMAGVLFAQNPADSKEPVYNVGNGVTPPRITRRVEPEHPAKGFKVTGAVLISVVITSKGEPDELRVIRSVDKDVDQNAMDAVKQWRFDPATKDGKPVAVRVSIEIRFHDI